MKIPTAVRTANPRRPEIAVHPPNPPPVPLRATFSAPNLRTPISELRSPISGFPPPPDLRQTTATVLKSRDCRRPINRIGCRTLAFSTSTFRSLQATTTAPVRCAVLIALLLSLTGCMVDLVSVRQAPATLTDVSAPGAPLVLQSDATVFIGTGFSTKLKHGTTWRKVGRLPEGEVFTTRDQIVTVEASNIHEAQPVIKDGQVVGFYLPVERTFTRASAPVAVALQAPSTSP